MEQVIFDGSEFTDTGVVTAEFAQLTEHAKRLLGRKQRTTQVTECSCALFMGFAKVQF